VGFVHGFGIMTKIANPQALLHKSGAKAFLSLDRRRVVLNSRHIFKKRISLALMLLLERYDAQIKQREVECHQKNYNGT
jgi:hypothetical protein